MVNCEWVIITAQNSLLTTNYSQYEWKYESDA